MDHELAALRAAAMHVLAGADIASRMGEAAKLPHRLSYARRATELVTLARNLESIAAKYGQREDAA